MTASDVVPDALRITVRFPGGVYRGADQGQPEALPSPARLHAAFVSAACGGLQAKADGRLLVAHPEDRAAVEWLEQHPPIGIIVPTVQATTYSAVRHRVRVAVDVKSKHDLHRDETPFEPFSALAGPVTFAWPPPPREIRGRLKAIAREITHLGRADSTAIVDVADGSFVPDGIHALPLASRRGPGRALAIAEPGRSEALIASHRDAIGITTIGTHGAGSQSKQAKDQRTPTPGERHTRLALFAEQRAVGFWPFSEAWVVPVTPKPPAWAVHPSNRVRTAISVHRAVVAAIGDDVPAFVTGRDGAGPLRGPGHMAIHFAATAADSAPQLVFGIPPGVPDADRSALLDALERRPIARIGGQHVRLNSPELRSGADFWETAADLFATAVPMIIDASGRPREGSWTLDDAVICSMGYALRRTLVEEGLEWGNGWSFRRELVAFLRENGANARAVRVLRGASRFAHRTRDGDLLVAAHAVVRLGDFGPSGRGLLALGRSRHLGGGLLQPLDER